MAFLEIDNLHKAFGSYKVLKGITFSLEKGEVLSIIGSSGNGKTTLIRCLNFLETPNSGTITLDGEQIFPHQRGVNVQKTIGMVFQNFNLFPQYSALKNVTLALDLKTDRDFKLRKKQVARELDKCKLKLKKLDKEIMSISSRLAEYKKYLKDKGRTSQEIKEKLEKTRQKYLEKDPNEDILLEQKDTREALNAQISDLIKEQQGLTKEFLKQQKGQNLQIANDILDRVGLQDKKANYPCELSGGQQQRVAIARALALKPDILCFDEPTSALDPELTGEVLRVIRSLRDEGWTMIIITHEMEFAKNVSDKVIFMANGVIEEMGTPEQVILNPTSEKTRAFLQRSLEKI